MTEPGREAEQLESSTPSRRSVPLVTAVVLVAAAVAVAVAGHAGNGRDPTHRPSPPVAASPLAHRSVAAGRLSVFVQPLGGCSRTARDGSVEAAVAVTDLTDRPLDIVGAQVTDPSGALRVREVRVGRRPCAAGGSAHLRVAAWGTAVVALRFGDPLGCPARGVGVTVSVRLGRRTLHTSAPTLLDLAGAHIAGCTTD